MGWKASVVAELAEVIANDSVNAEYRHLVARCSDTAAAGAPGQFFQLLCPQPAGEQPFLRRPMSLYGVNPARREVEFLYKVAGAGTRGLATLRAGDTVSTVDGKALHTIDDAADLYARFAGVKAATVQLIRNGKPVTLRVAIQ